MAARLDTQYGSQASQRKPAYYGPTPTRQTAVFNREAAPDPGQYLSNEVETNLGLIQQKFEGQWNLIQQNSKYLGPEKASQMLVALQVKAKGAISELQAQSAQRTDMMKRISTLRNQGAISDEAQIDPSNIDRMLWTIAAGEEVANSMFPSMQENIAMQSGQVGLEQQKLNLAQDYAGKPTDALGTYRDLTQQEGRLEKDLTQFHMREGERIPSFWKSKSKEARQPDVLQRFDPDKNIRYKSKSGVWVDEIGAYVDVPSGERTKAIAEMQSMQKQLDLVRGAKLRLRESPAIGGQVRRASAMLITGENPRGTMADKINASVVSRNSTSGRKPDQATAAQLKAENTEEAYNIGVKLGYWR